MNEAYRAEASFKKRKKSCAVKPDRRPPQPIGWRSLTPRQCQLNTSLWPKPGQPVMVPFPQDWREGVIESKEPTGDYVVKLNGTGSLITCSLSQILVKA